LAQAFYAVGERTYPPVEGTGLLVFESLPFLRRWAFELDDNEAILAGYGGRLIALPQYRAHTPEYWNQEELGDLWANLTPLNVVNKRHGTALGRGWPTGSRGVAWFEPTVVLERGKKCLFTE
jgi:hypothetical protein